MNKLILLAALAATLFASTEAAIALTAGTAQTIYKEATVAVTGITTGNHLCWTAAASTPAARTCAVAGSVTDIGLTGCSAATSGGATSTNLDWTTVAGVAVSIIECKANGDAQGDAAVALTFTDKNFVVTAGAAQTIYKGATVATTGAQTANWLCWKAGTEAGTVTCGAKSDKTDFGADGCSAANPSTLTLTWTTVAGTHVAIKECSAANTAAGQEVDVVFTDKNFAVTAGAAQTIYKGATVATSGAQTANWLCWKAGTAAGDVTCGAKSDKTDFGADGCSAANPSTLTLTWTTVAGTHVAIKECSAADTAAGEEVDVVFTDKNFVVTAGASQTIEKGAAVAISGVQTDNWLCWKAGTAAGDVTCGDVSDKTDIGLTGCSAKAPTSLTWTTLAGIHVAIKECSAASTAAGVEVDIVLTEANIAITGGAAQDLVAGAALVVTELGSGRHLCWKSGTSASAIDTCLAAGSATDAGATGCGAVDAASLAWTTVAGTHVSIIQCEGETEKGSAVATVLTEQIVVASQNITAGSIVTVAGLTTGNHLCWTAGTVAGAATCAAAGTAADLGVTGCGAADDNTIAWITTSKDYIAIKECLATANTDVGAEVDLVLGVTTTAAPTPTTTVSGASSEAAWSTMLTVFAIAMAAFSTL